MASLFDMAQTPQYVAPGGAALATRTQGSLFGLFPGTPEYAQAKVPAAVPPTPASVPVPVTVVEPSEVEVRVSIPGVVSVQGSLTVQPAVATALLGLARELLERESANAELDETSGADDAADEESARISETEQRVWERE